ncbi:hypothetical protein GEMRC1_007763 [Eukaryota sp. GEM-RC1]
MNLDLADELKRQHLVIYKAMDVFQHLLRSYPRNNADLQPYLDFIGHYCLSFHCDCEEEALSDFVVELSPLVDRVLTIKDQHSQLKSIYAAMCGEYKKNANVFLRLVHEYLALSGLHGSAEEVMVFPSLMLFIGDFDLKMLQKRIMSYITPKVRATEAFVEKVYTDFANRPDFDPNIDLTYTKVPPTVPIATSYVSSRMMQCLSVIHKVLNIAESFYEDNPFEFSQLLEFFSNYVHSFYLKFAYSIHSFPVALGRITHEFRPLKLYQERIHTLKTTLDTLHAAKPEDRTELLWDYCYELNAFLKDEESVYLRHVDHFLMRETSIDQKKIDTMMASYDQAIPPAVHQALDVFN